MGKRPRGPRTWAWWSRGALLDNASAAVLVIRRSNFNELQSFPNTIMLVNLHGRTLKKSFKFPSTYCECYFRLPTFSIGGHLGYLTLLLGIMVEAHLRTVMLQKRHFDYFQRTCLVSFVEKTFFHSTKAPFQFYFGLGGMANTHSFPKLAFFLADLTFH